jgi:hypothetical protein
VLECAVQLFKNGVFGEKPRVAGLLFLP